VFPNLPTIIIWRWRCWRSSLLFRFADIIHHKIFKDAVTRGMRFRVQHLGICLDVAPVFPVAFTFQILRCKFRRVTFYFAIAPANLCTCSKEGETRVREDKISNVLIVWRDTDDYEKTILHWSVFHVKKLSFKSMVIMWSTLKEEQTLLVQKDQFYYYDIFDSYCSNYLY